MASSTEPNSGLKYGWDFGETGWNEEMDANLLRIGRFGFHTTVLDRDLNDPPTTPDVGDMYIVAASAINGWLGLEDLIVCWDGTEWISAQPTVGWLVYIVDEQKISVYKVAGWSTGVGI